MINPARQTFHKTAQKAATDADQAEVVAVRNGLARVGDGLTDERLAGVPMAEESEIPHNPEGNEEWLDYDAIAEVATGGVADELLRRAHLLDAHYPFDLDPNGCVLTYAPGKSVSKAYEFCLALCETQNNLTAHPWCRAVREFERLVGRALSGHFGVGTEWYRLGVQSEPEDHRPGKLSDAIRELGKRTRGEWEFTPRTGADAQAEQGDGGIDVVVWKSFGAKDERIGMPFVLAQCGCGEEGLREEKWGSLQVRKFQDRFTVLISSAGVLRCFAFPHQLPHRAKWREAVSAGGIVLDRIRLTWMAETYLNGLEEQVRLQPHIDNLNTPPVRHKKKSATPPAKPAAKTRRP